MYKKKYPVFILVLMSVLSQSASAVGSNCDDGLVTIINNTSEPAVSLHVSKTENLTGGVPESGDIKPTSEVGSVTYGVAQGQTNFTANIYFDDESAYSSIQFHSMAGGCWVDPSTHDGQGLTVASSVFEHAVTITVTGTLSKT